MREPSRRRPAKQHLHRTDSSNAEIDNDEDAEMPLFHKETNKPRD